MPDQDWPEGVDTRLTKAPVGLPSERSSSSASEDVAERPPKRRQPTRGKQPVREGPMKKKKTNALPPHWGGGISFKEPSTH